MAKVVIKHGCGCGYSTTNLEEAIKHCNERKHTLTVLGTIKPESKK